MADLNWRNAILEVLKTEKDSVHYTDITELILERGLKTQVGATPVASVAATLSNSLNQEGDQSPFERVSRGYYRLRAQKTRSRPKSSALQPDEREETDTGLINAFGMYWRREAVWWSRPQILGQQQPGSTPVDFSHQRGVYLLHDRRDVVYVGRTTDQSLGDRLRQHTINRLNGRWDRFSWFGIYPVQADGSLAHDVGRQMNLDNLIETMEALLIESLEPPQNRKRGDGFSAVEFIQVVDPSIRRREQEEILEQMRKKL